MKKIIALLLILMTSLSLYSIEYPSEGDDKYHFVKVMPVYFFADIEAFFGFTDQNVSSVGEVTDIKNFDFTYNDITQNYETKNIYFYVQAFQGEPSSTYQWTVTLDGKVINETNSADTLSYNVKSSELPDGAELREANGEIEIEGALVIENNNPEYQKGMVILSIPGDTVFDKNVSYKGTLKMKLEVK